MTILFLFLTATTPHVKAHKLPAITVKATMSCATGEKYAVKDPFTGRAAVFCTGQRSK